MVTPPRVVIGVTLYNRAEYLPAALDSLRAQTYRDVRLVLVDDCSTDATSSIAQSYAALYPQMVYRRNEARLGVVRNWRRAFELARELYPGADFYAWGSDHDVWHPNWLACLVAELERHPEAVLAYPLIVRISETGALIQGPWSFDTAAISRPAERVLRAAWRMRAGSMVYGLFRAPALAGVGVYRPVLLPDNLLLAELALRGRFRQVPIVLWYRRFVNLYSLRRQRASFFPDGAPLYTYLPWWSVHAGVLAWTVGVRGNGRPTIGRIGGLALALAYLPVGAAYDLRRAYRRSPLRGGVQRARKLLTRRLAASFGSRPRVY